MAFYNIKHTNSRVKILPRVFTDFKNYIFLETVNLQSSNKNGRMPQTFRIWSNFKNFDFLKSQLAAIDENFLRLVCFETFSAMLNSELWF